MSSVRLTQMLKESIINNVNKKFQKPIQMAMDTLADDFGDRAYAFYYRKELQHMNALPDGFFETRDSLHVKLQNRNGTEITAHIKLTSYKPIAEYHTTWRESPIIINASLYDEYKLMIDEKEAVEQEQNNVEKLIKRGFNNATTLKKLLEMIPEIEMFIPDDALRTHYEKTEPKKRVKRETEDITATDDQKFAMAKVKMANL